MIEDIHPSPEDEWDRAAEEHYQSLVTGTYPLSFRQRLLVDRTRHMVRELKQDMEPEE